MAWITVGLFVCPLLICIYLSDRNNRVAAARHAVIDTIHSLGIKDIESGKDASARWELYEQGPSYDEMMLKFWVPVNKFFENHPALKP